MSLFFHRTLVSASFSGTKENSLQAHAYVQVEGMCCAWSPLYCLQYLAKIMVSKSYFLQSETTESGDCIAANDKVQDPIYAVVYFPLCLIAHLNAALINCW